MRKNKIKVIAGAIFFTLAIILSIMNFIDSKGIKVEEWNNFYNENNIVFFYENSSQDKIQELNKLYNINDAVGEEKNELDKILKVADLVNSIVEYDDVADTNLNSGYDILEEKKDAKKTSAKDIAIITRDMLTSINVYSRVGVFRQKDAQVNDKYEYPVLEYWSKENNKWIMLDPKDDGVFYNKDKKLSALEVLNSDIGKISYLGNTSQKVYKENIIKYLDSYSIAIDNSISDNKSNSYVTYLKDKVNVEIKYKNKFASPAIYTRESKLFEVSPYNRKYGRDEKGYIILAVSESEDKESANKNTVVNVIIGGFKDDKIMDKYYLNINGEGYEEVNKYKQITLNKGVTSIELSLDGTTAVSSVKINKQN